MRTLLCTCTNVWKVTYICCSEPLTASSDGTNDLRCTQRGSITRCKKHATHRVHHKLHRHMVFLCAMLLPYICVHKSARRWALCTRTVHIPRNSHRSWTFHRYVPVIPMVFHPVEEEDSRLLFYQNPENLTIQGFMLPCESPKRSNFKDSS